MFNAVTLAIAGQLLLLLILIRGFRSGTLVKYRLFYTYMGFVLLADFARDTMALLLGVTSRPYYFTYHLSNLPAPIFQVAILIDIYRRIFGNTKIALRRLIESVILALTIAVPIGWRVFSIPKVSNFDRYHAVMLFLQMLACVVVLRRVSGQRDVDPGRNLRGILAGICLLVGLQGMNFANYFFKDHSFVVFSFLLQFVYFLALAVFAYTLWNYAPIQILSAELRDRLDHVKSDVEKAVKGLMSTR